eukprot:Hpha_TRINITY_DN15420_c0_g1::TRINITY_DN15420_c0_g1_i2::g.176888::m.176888
MLVDSSPLCLLCGRCVRRDRLHTRKVLLQRPLKFTTPHFTHGRQLRTPFVKLRPVHYPLRVSSPIPAPFRTFSHRNPPPTVFPASRRKLPSGDLPGQQKLSGMFSRTSGFLSDEIAEVSKDKTKGVMELAVGGSGFKNLGNTCYMNAVICSLLSLDPFADAVISTARLYKFMGKSDGLLSALNEVVQLRYRGELEGRGVDLGQLKDLVGREKAAFRGNRQQDAHEFAVTLLDSLHEEVTSVYGREKENTLACNSASLVRRLFECGAEKKLGCLQCDGGTARYEERFFVVSAPIKDRIHDTAVDVDNLNPAPAPSLSSLLRHNFFNSECVERKCPGCSHGESELRIRISQLPYVMLLHAKRFHVEWRDGQVYTQKLLDDVVVPPVLDVSDLLAAGCKQPAERATSFGEGGVLNLSTHRPLGHRRPGGGGVYRLRAAVLHLGTGVRSGHYVSYFRSGDGQWWYADDERVTQLTGSDRDVCSRRSLTRNGYLFVYEWSPESTPSPDPPVARAPARVNRPVRENPPATVDAPLDDAPTDDSPVDDVPVIDTPVIDSPTDDVPTDDIPVVEPTVAVDPPAAAEPPAPVVSPFRADAWAIPPPTADAPAPVDPPTMTPDNAADTVDHTDDPEDPDNWLFDEPLLSQLK